MIIHIMSAIFAISIWVMRGTMFAYMAVPIFVVASLVLLFSLEYRKTPTYKYGASFFLHLSMSPLYIVLFSLAASHIFSSSNDYSIGFDIQTPDGVVSVVNNITIEDKTNPFRSLRQFYSGYSVVKGESNGIELSDDKSLIVLLSPLGSNTLSFLKGLPEWLKVADVEKTENGVTKYILEEKQTPAMVFLDDMNSPKSLSIVTSDSFSEIVGQEYSLVSSWVAFQTLTSANQSVTERWWNSTESNPSDRTSALRSLGVPQERFTINWESASYFLRI